MDTACQPSYPLNSENASPPGTFKVYLSWAVCATESATKATEAARVPQMLKAPKYFRAVCISNPFVMIGRMRGSAKASGPEFNHSTGGIALELHDGIGRRLGSGELRQQRHAVGTWRD